MRRKDTRRKRDIRRKETRRKDTRRKRDIRRKETRRKETRRKDTRRKDTRRNLKNRSIEKGKGVNKDMFDQKKIDKFIHKTTLKKGTVLWRTQPDKCGSLKIMECEDTGKKGIYLGTNKYVPIGMILEYNKPMNLCQYKLTKDVELYNGKYIFRYLEPERYFKNMDDLLNGKFILNVKPKKSTNHIDGGVKGAEDYLLPIHDDFNDFWKDKKLEKIWEKLKDSEVFLTDPSILKNVTEEKITVKQAKQIIADLKKK